MTIINNQDNSFQPSAKKGLVQRRPGPVTALSLLQRLAWRALYTFLSIGLAAVVFYAWNVLFESPLNRPFFVVATGTAFLLVFLWLIWPSFRPLFLGITLGLLIQIRSLSPWVATGLALVLILFSLYPPLFSKGKGRPLEPPTATPAAASRPLTRTRPPAGFTQTGKPAKSLLGPALRHLPGLSAAVAAAGQGPRGFLFLLVPGLLLGALPPVGPVSLFLHLVSLIKKDFIILYPYWVHGIPVQPDPPLAFLLWFSGMALGGWALALWIDRRRDVLWGGLVGVAFFIFQWLMGWDGATGYLVTYLFLLVFLQSLLVLQWKGYAVSSAARGARGNPAGRPWSALFPKPQHPPWPSRPVARSAPSVPAAEPAVPLTFWWLTTSILGLLGMLLLARSLPPAAPLSWEKATEFFQKTLPITERFRGTGEGTGGFEIGWSEGDLTASSLPLTSGSQMALRLYFPAGVPDRVMYLKGLTYSFYGNSSWSGTLQPSPNFAEQMRYSSPPEGNSTSSQSRGQSSTALPLFPTNQGALEVGTNMPRPLTQEWRTDQNQSGKTASTAPDHDQTGPGAGETIIYKVAPVSVSSRVLFTVGEPLAINGIKKIMLDNYGNLYAADEPLPKGYTVTSWLPEEPSLAVLQKAPPADPDLNPFLKTYLWLDLAKYRPQRQPYPQVSGAGTGSPYQATVLFSYIPDRVPRLAEALTAGAPAPWDKARALEDYLRGFKYSLNPPPLRPGQDLVDTFLFETKAGYCVHFASAMTVLLRAVGIPARLVEGFRLEQPSEDELQYTPDNLTGFKSQRTVLDVPLSAAHTWVEAFFPGVGWVTMEPTPAYSLPGRPEPPPLSKEKVTSPEGTEANPGGLLPTIGDWLRRFTPGQAPKNGVIWLSLLLLPAGLVYVRVRRLWKSPAGHIWLVYTLVSHLLAAAGGPRQKDETVREHLGRVMKELGIVPSHRREGEAADLRGPGSAMRPVEALAENAEITAAGEGREGLAIRPEKGWHPSRRHDRQEGHHSRPGPEVLPGQLLALASSYEAAFYGQPSPARQEGVAATFLLALLTRLLAGQPVSPSTGTYKAGNVSSSVPPGQKHPGPRRKLGLWLYLLAGLPGLAVRILRAGSARPRING